MKDKSPKVNILQPTEDDKIAKRIGLDNWSNDRMDMLAWRPFLGNLAMSLDIIPVVDHRCQTACTDGKRIFFNPHFLADLADDERMTILAHEIWHCALSHFTRESGRIDDHRAWNHAIDHEVNSLLEDDGFTIPKGAVLYRNFKGASAEQVFEKIKDGEIDMEGQVMDEHMLEGTDDKCNSGSGGFGTVEGDGDTEISLKVDSDFKPRRSDDVWKEWKARIMAASQQCQERGVDVGMYSRALDRLFEAKVPWRELLRQYLTPMFGGTRKWLPPNRRHVYKKIYLPSIQKQKQLNVVIVIDTSGSTDGEIVLAFMSEVLGLLNSFGGYQLRLIQCDWGIQDDAIYDQDTPFDPDKFELKGGGGTDFNPPFDLLDKDSHDRPEILIYMTDGYGSAPSTAPNYPVIWAVIEGGRMPCDWGHEIEIPLGD